MPREQDERAPPLRECDGRLLVSIRVSPRSRRDTLAIEGDVLRVRLRAAPVEGAANDALIALLAKTLHVPSRAIQLERGATARTKLVAIDGLSAADFLARVARAT